jgi:hypothetical protein
MNTWEGLDSLKNMELLVTSTLPTLRKKGKSFIQLLNTDDGTSTTFARICKSHAVRRIQSFSGITHMNLEPQAIPWMSISLDMFCFSVFQVSLDQFCILLVGTSDNANEAISVRNSIQSANLMMHLS